MGAQEDDKVVFKYVYIPADQTEGIEQRNFECPQSDDVLGFINMCKAHFRSMAAPRSREEEQQWQQAFKASMGDKAKGVSDDMLNMLAGQQMVEPIALLANSPETGFVGVYMYCDDQASLKHLPHNMRATQIAAEAGQALQVSGDVFIGRYFDNEEDFQRLDFTLSELNSSAPWIKEARQQIMRRSERSGSSSAQELMQRLQQPPQQGAAAATAGAAGSSGGGAAAKAVSPSDAEKDKGNAAYKQRDFHAALGHYTAAIKLDDSNTAARNNRALTYLTLNMFKEAAADASEVIKAEPSNVKALLRRAAAHEGMGQLQEAATDCQAALQLQPRNTDAQERLAKLQQQLGATSSQQQQGGASSQQQQQQQEDQQQGFPPPPAEQ